MKFAKSASSSCIALATSAMLIGLAWHDTAVACSTALWTPAATHNGTPMLWKNRDTDSLSNKVIFVPATPLRFLALVDANNTSGNEAWAGVNQTGLAIMNSVAYNLPLADDEVRDREGKIMAEILRTCRTVFEAEAYFKKNLNTGLGVQANFGVMDGEGNVILLEANNHAYSKIDVAAAPGGYLVNTNFSRSGAAQKGAGYLRFERVTSLLQQVPSHEVSPMMVFGRLARDFINPLLLTPSLAELSHLSVAAPLWSPTVDTIDRADTSAAVVIEGKQPSDPSSRAIFWVTLGEPLATLAIPLWVEAGSTPAVMYEGKDAPLYLEALRIQKIYRPFSESDKRNYINLTRLANREGSGTYTPLAAAQNEIFAATDDFLRKNPSDAQLAPFQEKMAALALAALRAIH